MFNVFWWLITTGKFWNDTEMMLKYFWTSNLHYDKQTGRQAGLQANKGKNHQGRAAMDDASGTKPTLSAKQLDIF